MSTEQRDVRPFSGPPSLESLLRHAVLRFGVHAVESGARVIVEDHEFVNAPARLVLPNDLEGALRAAGDALAAIDVSTDQLAFAVILQSGFLKLMDTPVNRSMKELVGGSSTFELTEQPRPDAFRVPRSGCRVEAIIYFNDERPRRVRQPWRFGTWLARATFDVVTESAFAGFTPQPLTPSKKVELKLSPKTARYVRCSVSPFDQGATEDLVEVWCDADLLAKMSANGKAPGSVALQRQLFVDAIGAIISAAVTEKDKLAESAWADVEDTLLGRVISVVAPSATTEQARVGACTTYLEMIKHDPAAFMSYAEDVAGLLNSYDGIAGG